MGLGKIEALGLNREKDRKGGLVGCGRERQEEMRWGFKFN